MKRSLIVGAVLLVALVLTSFIIPSTASEDGQEASTTEQITKVCYDAQKVNVEPAESPKIKENAKAFDDIKEGSMNEETYITYYTDEDITMLAQLLYNEGRGINSITEQACIVWTVLNRVDASDGATIEDIVTAENQFAYSSAPLLDNLVWIAEDVLSRWNAELNGETSVGRVLPSDYKWFGGDGEHNYFRNAYAGSYVIWDYSLPSPYES